MIKKIIVANLTLIHIPTHCSIAGPKLKIRTVHTMKIQELEHSVMFIPFQLTDDDIIMNVTGVDPGVLPHLAAKGIRDLLSSKVRTSFHIPEEIHSFDFTGNSHMSIAAVSTSSIVAALCIAAAIVFCILLKKSN